MVAGKIPKEQCGISSAVVLPGTKGVYRRSSMLWKKLVEGRYWKLIDEKAHQSTEGIVASSSAHYDTSRSAPQASRLQ